MSSRSVVEMRRVRITKGSSTILHNVDLRIEQGERIVILGPNGSGKSTLIRTMTGDDRFDTSVEGAMVSIRGKEDWSLFDVRKAFGVVSGELQYQFHRDVTALEAVVSGFFGSVGTNRSQEVTDMMVDEAKRCMSLVGTLHLGNRVVSTLSTGEARRVIMARALVNRPEALILDEPMSSLDLTGKSEVRKAVSALANEGRTVIMTTHDPSDIVPEISRVIMMRGGTIFRDGDMGLLREGLLSELYGTRVHVIRTEGRYFAWT
jgi:iron complex transport system ATP-binding protein